MPALAVTAHLRLPFSDFWKFMDLKKSFTSQLGDLVPTILKWELQNQQRHFCTSTTTVHYPRGSSHIVLLQYWNAKPIFGVRISGQSMLPDGCWNYMSKDRSVAKFVVTLTTTEISISAARRMRDASWSLNYFVMSCHSCHDLFCCTPRQALFVQIGHGIWFYI